MTDIVKSFSYGSDNMEADSVAMVIIFKDLDGDSFGLVKEVSGMRKLGGMVSRELLKKMFKENIDSIFGFDSQVIDTLDDVDKKVLERLKIIRIE